VRWVRAGLREGKVSLKEAVADDSEFWEGSHCATQEGAVW
jgi:hypothetical protein